MWKVCLYLLILIQYSESFSQITITNDIFPKAGDTLKTIFTLSVSGGLNLGTTGGPKTWDFSQLSTGIRQQEIYLNASAGKDVASFPEANLIVRSGGQDLYIKSSPTKMEGLGFGGSNPFLDTNLVIKYIKRPVLRRAPIDFITTSFTETEFRLDLSTKIIPDTILATLPVKPDSIRIQFSNSLRGIVDAYGKLKIQNKIFDVIREKAESINETKLFVKILGLWLDPLSLFNGNLPGGFSDLLGKDTTIVYNFYSNIRKEAIVSAEYDASGTFLGVTFVDLGGLLSSVADQNYNPLSVFPNPASDSINFRAPDVSGRYMVTASDLAGRVVYLNFLDFDETQTTQIDSSDWPDGFYLLSIMNTSNKKTYTFKVIIE